MEFGDIIYFLLLVFFMILGFFNDSRKKKIKEKQLEKETSIPSRGEFGEAGGTHQEVSRKAPPPKPFIASPVREFQSSMSQASDFTKYESGDSIDFDYDLDSFDNTKSRLAVTSRPRVPDSPEIPVESRNRRTSDGKNRGGIHPLVAELQGEGAGAALKKGIIYSELLNRRY